MIHILNEVFEETLEDYPTKYVGNKIYIKLDDNRRIELSFYKTPYSSEFYDAVKLVLLHKNNGELHRQIIKFEDIFYCMQDWAHPNKIRKYIWHNDKKYRWYGRPTKEDLEALNETLITYIETWI